jgi:dTMP kinase
MSEDGRGLLIVFEGIDGTGKSTQVDALTQALKRGGRGVVRSAEPTQGPFGAQLRASMAEGRLTPDEELDLFIKDRRDHVKNLIRPALERGDVVVLDRYYFSTIAYQGARRHDPKALRVLNESFAPAPDLLIVLDLDPELSLERIRGGRGDKPDTFEVPDLLVKSRAIFLGLAAELAYAHVIDASQSSQAITAEVSELVGELLNGAAAS